MSLRQDITSPLPATVFIDADFTEVTPGSGIGAISEVVEEDGGAKLTFQTSLSVDLHVEVQPPGGGTTFLAADCRTSPVNLTFETTSPYDPNAPEGDREITVEDANFSIPPMIEEPACASIIMGEINNQLAGAGHSLSLTLEGDITPPPPPQCPTTTTLSASPEGEAELATPVELTATVVPVAADPLCIEAATNGDVLTGFVDFFDGVSKIGRMPVAPDGTAMLTSSSIPAGTRSLTAAYVGAFPFEGSSTTEGLSYRITPNPTISSDIPEFVRIDAAPTEFDVSVTNTGFGGAITNGRLDLTLGRPPGFSADLDNDRVLMEYLDSTNAWLPVILTGSGGSLNLVLSGHVGPATGFALGVGETMTQRVRIRFTTTGGTPSTTACAPTNETCPGPVTIAVEMVEVDSSSGLPAAVVAPAPGAITSASGTITVIEATRRASSVSFGSAFGGGPVSPYKLRQGGTVSLPGMSVGPNLSSRRPTGLIEVLLDGQRIPVRQIIGSNAAPDAPPVDQTPLFSGGVSVSFDLPSGIALGSHEITVRYLGDPVFLPSENATMIDVIEPTGVLYDCFSPSTTNTRYRAFVESQIASPLPAVRPAGSSLALPGLSLRLLFSRDVTAQNNSRSALAPSNGSREVGSTLSVDVGFGPGGTGTAAGITRANGVRLPGSFASPTSDPVDEIITLDSPAGTAVLNGDPGALVPVTLDEIKLTGTNASNLTIPVTCTPMGDPVTFGSVTLSGNTLTVEPEGSVWEGDPVTLTSEVEPYTTGQVEFRDGSTTIGVVPVVDGLASTVITDLPAGTRSLTAVWSGGILAPALTSNTVSLEVIHVDCKPFAQDGNGALVRLTYLELLGRCPDQAGFDYWVDRLENGLSAEAFARTIARTPEAVGRVVDDAYQTMLGRSAEAGGRAFWTTRLLGHGRYDQLLADLGASDEFWDLSGETNIGFVTRVYERLLQRSPDQGGLDFWTGKLATGTSRRVLILTLANLDEPLGVLVTDSYDEILDRVPDAGERSAGITHLRSTSDRSGLYAQLIGRPEFATRAGTFPNLT